MPTKTRLHPFRTKTVHFFDEEYLALEGHHDPGRLPGTPSARRLARSF
jgi:hypothetical protein